MHSPSFTVLSVKQLNFYVKSLLEGDPRLSLCAVAGEISNYKCHYASGHCYFTLKDASASVKCVMFKSSAAKCPFPLHDGMQVICCGRVSLYDKDGTYQFYVETAEPTGQGNQALLLAQLKEKLQKEGLFDEGRKRPLPLFPRRIAVVTSGGGAALQDILKIIGRRCPVCEIVLGSVSVQGNRSVPEMLSMLTELYEDSTIDTLIIGRGGGSSEDLAAFNDERLARLVAKAPFPVISAVGHQTDLSVCDLVADRRAATPSEAAELAVPDLAEWMAKQQQLLHRIRLAVVRKVEHATLQLRAIKGRSAFAGASVMLHNRMMLLDHLTDRAMRAVNQSVQRRADELSLMATRLESLNPLSVLARGFACVTADGRVVTNPDEVAIGSAVQIRLSGGRLDCRVERKEKNEF